LETMAVPEAGFKLRLILTRGFPRRAWWKWPFAALANAIGLLQALWIVAFERPDVVLGTGGYVSGPVALAAWLMRRPLLIQEQNSIPGLTNRWLARLADEVHLSFVEARSYFARKGRVEVQWILQTGREDFTWAQDIVQKEQLPARVVPFLNRIHLAYAAADLVV